MKRFVHAARLFTGFFLLAGGLFSVVEFKLHPSEISGHMFTTMIVMSAVGATTIWADMKSRLK